MAAHAGSPKVIYAALIEKLLIAGTRFTGGAGRIPTRKGSCVDLRRSKSHASLAFKKSLLPARRCGRGYIRPTPVRDAMILRRRPTATRCGESAFNVGMEWSCRGEHVGASCGFC